MSEQVITHRLKAPDQSDPLSTVCESSSFRVREKCVGLLEMVQSVVKCMNPKNRLIQVLPLLLTGLMK